VVRASSYSNASLPCRSHSCYTTGRRTCMQQPCRPSTARLIKQHGSQGPLGAIGCRRKKQQLSSPCTHVARHNNTCGPDRQGKGCEVVQSICRHISKSAHATCGRGGAWSVSVRSVSVSHTWQVKRRALAPHRARCSHRRRRGLASPRGTQPAPGCVSRRSSSGGSS